VPFSFQLDILSEVKDVLSGKILIDGTVPLVPPKVMRVQLPEEGCAAIRAQTLLGDSVQVISAFQNISAELLQTDAEIDCDVLVCGDKRDSREQVIALVNDAGLTGWHAGPLCNSAAAEALTSVLIAINKNHTIKHSGIKITGV
jgi:NADPH-dependent F420 reductase